MNYDDGHGEKGGREDNGKPRVDLLPPDALIAVAEVLAHGAKKYDARNWEKGMSWSRVIGSLLRHTFKRMMGEMMDPETHLLHSAHIATNALFLLTYELRGIGHDDL